MNYMPRLCSVALPNLNDKISSFNTNGKTCEFFAENRCGGSTSFRWEGAVADLGSLVDHKQYNKQISSFKCEA
ncbi:hypothetical protein LZ554_004591 [Drepanopeziza brunnea f. sp. 'monogermtubi']|nr:hypothetical protein LZ554_004591 [Drepanopeziza brunnea f. sp. 'monogermtubi']